MWWLRIFIAVMILLGFVWFVYKLWTSKKVDKWIDDLVKDEPDIDEIIDDVHSKYDTLSKKQKMVDKEIKRRKKDVDKINSFVKSNKK